MRSSFTLKAQVSGSALIALAQFSLHKSENEPDDPAVVHRQSFPEADIFHFITFNSYFRLSFIHPDKNISEIKIVCSILTLAQADTEMHNFTLGTLQTSQHNIQISCNKGSGRFKAMGNGFEWNTISDDLRPPRAVLSAVSKHVFLRLAHVKVLRDF